MRRILAIVLFAAVAACAAPDSPGAPDGGPGADVSGTGVGAGVDVADDVRPMLESGELLNDLADFDADDVVLRDAGEFLFLFGDGSELGWMQKSDGNLITILHWPDAEHEGAGRASRDYAFGDERVWFVAEMGDGTSAVVGAEHDLGNPFPFFGQPIVIIDVGPLTSPSGISIDQNRLIAAFEKSEGRFQPRLVVATEQGGVQETVQLDRDGPFDRLDTGPDGTIFWTYGEPDGAELQAFRPGEDLQTLEWPTVVPLASAADDDGYFWLLEPGEVWARPAGDATGSMLANLVLTDGADAEMAAHDGAVAVWSTDRIHVIEDGVVDHVVASEGEVHSLILDASSIFWSTTQGVYRYDLER